jgi:tyrosine-protein kinase Etk/Wzc
MSTNPIPQVDTGGFNLKDFLIRYIKYLPLILLGIIISYFAAKLKLRYTTSMYQASGTMLVKDDKQPKGDSKAVEELFTSKAGNDLATEIQLMKSRSLMKRVVKSLGLQNSYYNKGKVKTSIIYERIPIELIILTDKDSTSGISFEIKVINTDAFEIVTIPGQYKFGQDITYGNKVIRINKTPFFSSTLVGQKMVLNWQPLESISEALSQTITVTTLGDFTRILRIAMVSESAQKCVDVVNQLMTEYIKDNLETSKQVSEFTKVFIDERVKSLENDLRGEETGMREFREKTNSINLDAQSQIYLSDLNDARKELSKQLLLIGNAKTILQNFDKDDNLKDYAPTGILDDNNLQNLFLEYNNAQFAKQQLRKEFASEAEPTYIQKTNDVKRVKAAIMGGLSKLIAISEINATQLEKVISENTQKLRNVPGLQDQLVNYDRNRKTVEELYLFLKKKGEEAGITSAQTLSNSKIIDPALINNGPISPVRSKVYSLALFLGLLIPAALAYIIELFNDKIRYRDDIQKQTNTPIIAEVGHSDGTQTLVVTSKSRKVIAEQFRMIRTNIQYLVGTKSKFTVLITSSFSGEGKSFISTNVAAALALTGKKTVILEFDLRKPKIIEGLGMVKAAGISNFVVGKADIKDIIRPVPNYDNLFVVGCGAIPPNPAELLLEDNITELFNYLQSNFDAVIIDSAPVGLVTDSMTLSKFADTTLYIVRHKYTLKKQIKLVDELYTSEKLPKLSIVINDVIGSTGGYYGYGGYGYGYGRSYGYGYGYFEEVKRNRLKEIWNSIKSFLSFWK